MLPTKVMYFENSCDRLPNKYFFIRSSCENMILCICLMKKNLEDFFNHFSFRTSTIMVFLWDFIFFQIWAFWIHRDAVLCRGRPSLWLLESENVLEACFFFLSHLSSVVVWVVFIFTIFFFCWQHREVLSEQGEDSEWGMWWTLLSGCNLQ